MAERSLERLRDHYDIECELASRLRHSTRAERTSGLYSRVYQELFSRVADHPQHAKMASRQRQEQVEASVKILAPWIKPDATILELGAGDSALSLALARKIKRAVALDVADLVSEQAKSQPGFELVISDGVHVPLDDHSVDAAYSYQLMEHLHIDDARDQLGEIFRVLKPGGVYICNTPNALSGPHDISKFFHQEAVGFHLKEYTYRELARLTEAAGFREMRALIAVRYGLRFGLPIGLACRLETLACRLAKHARRSAIMHRLLGIQMVVVKPAA